MCPWHPLLTCMRHPPACVRPPLSLLAPQPAPGGGAQPAGGLLDGIVKNRRVIAVAVAVADVAFLWGAAKGGRWLWDRQHQRQEEQEAGDGGGK